MESAQLNVTKHDMEKAKVMLSNMFPSNTLAKS